MNAIPIPDIKYTAASPSPVEAGHFGPLSDQRQRALRLRSRALVALRVVVVLLLLTLAFVTWDGPMDRVPATVETCLAQHADEDPDAMIASCVGGAVARALRAAWLMRTTVAMLLVAIALSLTLSMLMHSGYRKLLQEDWHFEQQLIDALPLPLSLRSADGALLRVNKAFEVRYGLSRDEVIGKRVIASVGTEAAAAVALMQERAMRTDEPVEQEFELEAPDGRRYVLARLRALRRADGSLIGLLGVQTDITALRRKESELTENNARLKQLSMRLLAAQEDERRRIARDLHDQVGQILTALKLQLRSLAQHPSIDRPATALAYSIDLAEEALGHTRNLSTSLHPHLLDDLGLEQALNWLVDRFIRPAVPTTDIACRLNPPRGEAHVERVAFRVVQEALTNVVRHAHASRVGVMLEAAGGELTIEVLDDGIGFDGAGEVDLLRTSSLGLTSMYERVSECGGEMHIDSTPGVGTSLRVRLPWKATKS